MSYRNVEVLEIIQDEENLQNNACLRGKRLLRNGLSVNFKTIFHTLIGDVRGFGSIL